MKYIVGAYVTSPCLFNWDQKAETEFYEGIKLLKQIRGLEHPFWGSLHPFDENWFLNNLSPEWDIVLTCVPGTMKNMINNPEFGLASDADSGRKAALDFMRIAQESVKKINSHMNRQAVIAVQFVSAPNQSADGVSSSCNAFYKSLEDLCSWDWQGANLVVEHCDAYVEGQMPEKGFLRLEDEITAIQGINRNSTDQSLGVMVNWGRSAIECRNVSGPLQHIAMAKEAKLLKALFFSGCSASKTPYGVWKDTHMPPPQEYGNDFYVEYSLMSAHQIQKSLELSDFQQLDYLGIKIMAIPEPVPMKRRIGLNRDTLNLLDEVIKNIKSI